MEITVTNRLDLPATYDAAGNLTSWGGFTYQWRPTGELRSRTGTGLNKWFAYDAAGERVVVHDELTDTTTYTLRGLSGKVLRVFEKDGSGWSWEKDYIYRQDQPLAMVDPSGAQHFSLDHLGTIRYVSDSSGNEVIEHAYYGFGEKASAVWDNEPMKFTGHERDLEGTTDTIDDLDYMHARYYNPNIGRFLSVDPVGGSVGSSQSWNRYSYVLDNPINLVDPFGLEPIDECSDDGVCRGSITVTADAPPPRRDLFLTVPEEIFGEWAEGTDINDRLRAQPWVGSPQSVLEAGFVDPFEPCRESFEVRFDRSMDSTKDGLGRAMEMAAQNLVAKLVSAGWVAKRVGTSTAIKYSWSQGRRLLPGTTGAAFSWRAFAGAAASSTLGGLLVEPAYWLGLHGGTAVNVLAFEPIFDPCTK